MNWNDGSEDYNIIAELKAKVRELEHLVEDLIRDKEKFKTLYERAIEPKVGDNIDSCGRY